MSFNSNNHVITLYMKSFLCKGAPSNIDAIPEGVFDRIPDDHIFWFPDGTLQISDEDNRKLFESTSYVKKIRDDAFQFTCNHFPSKRGGSPVFSHWGLTLFPFMRDSIAIWVWENSPQLFRDLKGKIFFDPFILTIENNRCPLSDTTVHVVFKKKINAGQRTMFTEIVYKWLVSKLNYRVPGIQKVKLNYGGIDYFQSVARFSVDITDADQNIITFFMLQIIHFSKMFPIEGVYFTRYYQIRSYAERLNPPGPPMRFIDFAEHFKLMDPIVCPCPCPETLSSDSKPETSIDN